MLKFYAVQSEKGALDEFPFLRWLSLQPVVVGLGEYKINAFSVWLPYKCCAAENYLMNVRYGRRSQPVDATHSANFSAGVGNERLGPFREASTASKAGWCSRLTRAATVIVGLRSRHQRRLPT